MKIALFGKVYKVQAHYSLLTSILEVMQEIGLEVSIFAPFYEQIQVKLPLDSFDTFNEIDECNPDLLVTIGGDGTLLHSIKHTKRGEIPVLGINTGRLGFLTSTNKDEIRETFEAIKQKKYYIEKRSILLLKSEDKLFGEWNFALNECTVMKSESTSMITVHAYIDGEFLNSYWGDGLIISTPTGSTGYSLSCGGPIIIPNSKTLIITPIAPHNLSIRPIVLTDDKVVHLRVEGRSDHFLCTLDARSTNVSFNKELTLHKAPFHLKMVRLRSHSFYGTIRQKLMWGADRRNNKK